MVSLTATPYIQKIIAGKNAFFQLSSDYSNPLDLAVTGLPNSSVTFFTANPIAAASVFQLATTSATLLDTYEITITGTYNGTVITSCKVTLVVGQLGVDEINIPGDLTVSKYLAGQLSEAVGPEVFTLKCSSFEVVGLPPLQPPINLVPYFSGASGSVYNPTTNPGTSPYVCSILNQLSLLPPVVLASMIDPSQGATSSESTYLAQLQNYLRSVS
jgi:hypothetical protein